MKFVTSYFHTMHKNLSSSDTIQTCQSTKHVNQNEVITSCVLYAQNRKHQIGHLHFPFQILRIGIEHLFFIFLQAVFLFKTVCVSIVSSCSNRESKHSALLKHDKTPLKYR